MIRADYRTQYYANISISKGILIILMVVGHSGINSLAKDFIYNFHMPCFFLISGFLFKEEYLDNIGTFVAKKIKGLYVPFVKYSLFFLLLHNIFYHLHLYNNCYTLEEFIIRLLKTPILIGAEQLLGGFWFLEVLLYASLLSIISFKIAGKLKKKKLLLLCTTFTLLAYIQSTSTLIKIPIIGSNTLLATAFFIVGFLYRKTNIKSNNNLVIAIVGYIITFIASLFIKGNIDIQGVAIFPYFVVSIIGSVSTIHLARSITNSSVGVLLDHIGKNTLYILTFHFISFKILSYIIIQINDWPISRLSEFPVLNDNNAYIWILYTIIGVTVPLIIKRFFDIIEESSKSLYNKYSNRTANDTHKV